MAANRCSICALDWPPETRYQKCPQCRLSTSFVGNIDAMTPRQAKRLCSQFEFEHYYEEWDAHGPPSRVDPHADEDIMRRWPDALVAGNLSRSR